MTANNNIILLVEDNPDDEELTRLAFAEFAVSHELAFARDGQDALDYLFGEGKYSERGSCKPPRLILLDLKLPKIDGLEVLRRTRADARTRNVPVVVLTSSKEESDMSKSYTLGANSYIQKRVDFTQFVDTVHQLGLYWLTLNEVPYLGQQ